MHIPYTYSRNPSGMCLKVVQPLHGCGLDRLLQFGGVGFRSTGFELQPEIAAGMFLLKETLLFHRRFCQGSMQRHRENVNHDVGSYMKVGSPAPPLLWMTSPSLPSHMGFCNYAYEVSLEGLCSSASGIGPEHACGQHCVYEAEEAI